MGNLKSKILNLKLCKQLPITDYRLPITLLFCLLLTINSLASTNYVWQGSPTPTLPYSSWATAAHNIQSAVDAASPGDLVLVSNGVYNSVGRITPEYSLSNCVAITINITVRSISGPENTFILGSAGIGGGNNTGAVRCVFMTAGSLDGFTVSNGHTLTSGSHFYDRSGGGIWSTNGCIVTNCIVNGNASDYDAGGVLCLYGGLVNNCKINGNEAYIGGGIFCYYGGRIDNCTFTGNHAEYGGGVHCSYDGLVNNCTINRNTADDGGGVRCYKGGVINNSSISSNNAEYGGGVQIKSGGAAVSNCKFIDNTAEYGGGIRCKSGGVVNNSTFTGNYAEYGGGAHCGTSSTFNNCSITLNSAFYGGGVYCYEGGVINNCTISGNDAFAGGGIICDEGGTLTNTIIFSNTDLANNNWINYETGMNYAYCCTMPDPGGTGNITNNPLLVNFAHIATNSPCVGMGDGSVVTGVDIDGEAWLNPPAIGCDQPTLAGLTGKLSVVVYAEMTNLTVDAQCRFTGYVNGRADIILWSFGDGTTETNASYIVDHAWNVSGEYPVILTALNSDNPSGVSETVAVHVVSESTHYVVPENSTPEWPYISWTTAATNIQYAIDACYLGGKVLVTNGIYATGMNATPKLNMPNRVVLTKNILVESVNGPDTTIILGSPDSITGGNGTNAVRCLYMSAGTVSGFTFSNGHTRTYGDYDYERSGGGVLCNFNGIITNCIVSGNKAYQLAGGVYCLYNGIVRDCKIIGNSSYHGGGIHCYYGSSVINSIISGNSCNSIYGEGGGLMCEYGGVINKCIIKNNAAGRYGGGVYCYRGGIVSNCKIIANYATNIYKMGLGGGIMLNAYANAYNCLITGNSGNKGGGVFFVLSAINNCTISGNSTDNQGGGVWCSGDAFLTNCIIYFNTAPSGSNWYCIETTNYAYCCTVPRPYGIGNTTNNPTFLNPDADSYHLLEASPCIDSGTNLPWMISATDLDDNPRIYDGTVDMGCYEYIPEPFYLSFIIYYLLFIKRKFIPIENTSG